MCLQPIEATEKHNKQQQTKVIIKHSAHYADLHRHNTQLQNYN